MKGYIDRAYKCHNRAEHLLLKAVCRYMVRKSRILSTALRPKILDMEAMEGTGADWP